MNWWEVVIVVAVVWAFVAIIFLPATLDTDRQQEARKTLVLLTWPVSLPWLVTYRTVLWIAETVRVARGLE